MEIASTPFQKSPFFLELAYEACRCFVVRKLLFVKKQVTFLKHLELAATQAIMRVIIHSNTNKSTAVFTRCLFSHERFTISKQKTEGWT